MRFRRRGGRKRIVAPVGGELVPASKPQPDGTLIKALARAWRWQRMLDKGLYMSVSEIGDAENISKSYVSRILRLALVAPDIVEAILAGRTNQSIDSGEAGAADAGDLAGAAHSLVSGRREADYAAPAFRPGCHEQANGSCCLPRNHLQASQRTPPPVKSIVKVPQRLRAQGTRSGRAGIPPSPPLRSGEGWGCGRG